MMPESTNDEPMFIIKYGWTEIDSRFEPDGKGGLMGMCRRREYDRDGILTHTSEWEPTGAVIQFYA